MMKMIDWQKYRELEGLTREQMTEEEWEFFKYMYHVEEYESGLDGGFEYYDED